MLNVCIIDKSYLEATGIDRILKNEGCEVKTEHHLNPEALKSRIAKTPIDVMLIDTTTVGKGIEAFTKIVKERRPEPTVVWLMPEQDIPTEYDAICAGADGCVPKSDFASIVDVVKKAGTGEVLFDNQLLLDFARQASVLVPRSGRQLSELTPRERQVLEQIRQGATNKQIAKQLFVSVETVKVRVKSIRDKLGIVSRRQLIGGIPSRASDMAVEEAQQVQPVLEQ